MTFGLGNRCSIRLSYGTIGGLGKLSHRCKSVGFSVLIHRVEIVFTEEGDGGKPRLRLQTVFLARRLNIVRYPLS